MIKNQRLDEILNIVQKNRHVTVAELADRLYASPATIRRDIALLERSELIVKSYGGISLAGGHNRFVELDQRAEAHRTEKLQIGRTAAALYRRAGFAPEITVLPSTSPANAAWSVSALADAWGKALLWQ